MTYCLNTKPTLWRGEMAHRDGARGEFDGEKEKSIESFSFNYDYSRSLINIKCFGLRENLRLKDPSIRACGNVSPVTTCHDNSAVLQQSCRRKEPSRS